MAAAVSREHVEAWVRDYVTAWTTYTRGDIAALFSTDAEYHEWPYETAWIGRDAIIDGLNERQDWQAGGWTFDWSVAAISGDTASEALRPTIALSQM
jgi:hypothetical protein